MRSEQNSEILTTHQTLLKYNILHVSVQDVCVDAVSFLHTRANAATGARLVLARNYS
jgi:hypothetical protein